MVPSASLSLPEDKDTSVFPVAPPASGDPLGLWGGVAGRAKVGLAASVPLAYHIFQT